MLPEKLSSWPDLRNFVGIGLFRLLRLMEKHVYDQKGSSLSEGSCLVGATGRAAVAVVVATSLSYPLERFGKVVQSRFHVSHSHSSISHSPKIRQPLWPIVMIVLQYFL
jgi:hypothetical protein